MSKLDVILHGRVKFKRGHNVSVARFSEVFKSGFGELHPKDRTKAVCQELQEYLNSRKP